MAIYIAPNTKFTRCVKSATTTLQHQTFTTGAQHYLLHLGAPSGIVTVAAACRTTAHPTTGAPVDMLPTRDFPTKAKVMMFPLRPRHQIQEQKVTPPVGEERRVSLHVDASSVNTQHHLYSVKSIRTRKRKKTPTWADYNLDKECMKTSGAIRFTYKCEKIFEITDLQQLAVDTECL